MAVISERQKSHPFGKVRIDCRLNMARCGSGDHVSSWNQYQKSALVLYELLRTNREGNRSTSGVSSTRQFATGYKSSAIG